MAGAMRPFADGPWGGVSGGNSFWRAVSDALIKAAFGEITRNEKDRIFAILGISVSHCALRYEDSQPSEHP